MTTLRKELREALQWCLKQHFPFKSADMVTALDSDRFLVNRKLRTFVEMGILDREQDGGSGMPYTYSICDRGLAESLASETPIRVRTYYRKTNRSAWAGASSIFSMGA